MKAIVDDGVTYVQVDAPGYSRFIVPERLKEQVLDQGLDPEKELDAVLAAENALLRAAKRDGVTVAVHICLGTYILGPQGPLGGGGSTYVAPTIGKIIDRLEADTFLIEYSGRSGALEFAARRAEAQDHLARADQHPRSAGRDGRRTYAQARNRVEVRADGKSQHLSELRLLRRSAPTPGSARTSSVASSTCWSRPHAASGVSEARLGVARL